MFHRFLVPVKPATQPHLALKTLVGLARASNATLVFVAVEEASDLMLTGRSAGLVFDVEHERRDLAEAALHWVEERTHGQGLDVQTALVRGNVVDALLRAAEDYGCDAIVLTRRPKSRPGFLTGNTGDAIARKSGLPILVLAPDE